MVRLRGLAVLCAFGWCVVGLTHGNKQHGWENVLCRAPQAAHHVQFGGPTPLGGEKNLRGPLLQNLLPIVLIVHTRGP